MVKRCCSFFCLSNNIMLVGLIITKSVYTGLSCKRSYFVTSSGLWCSFRPFVDMMLWYNISFVSRVTCNVRNWSERTNFNVTLSWFGGFVFNYICPCDPAVNDPTCSVLSSDIDLKLMLNSCENFLWPLEIKLLTRWRGCWFIRNTCIISIVSMKQHIV